MWRTALLYGAALAAGTFALAWFDYLSLVRGRAQELYAFGIAAAFLALGVYVGARAIGRPPVSGRAPA